MKILLTGCAGFIGYHTTSRLLKEGHQVTGIDNLNSYYMPSLKIARLRELGVQIDNTTSSRSLDGCPGFKFLNADITDKLLLNELLAGQKFDAVCNLAAQAGVRYSMENPDLYISSNIQGFLNILEYCRANPQTKLVFASSSSVYGKNTDVPYKEDQKTETPVSLYAVTKKSDELMAHCYADLFGIQAIGLRFFTVYGPWGRPDMAPFLFTDAILNDREIKIFNQGDMTRDFTYIDDIVEGICKVLLKEPKRELPQSCPFRIYNIGNSEPVNLMKFIEAIEQITNKTAKKVYLPMQPGDLKDTWADTSQLFNDYGYQPSVTIEKGLKQFIDWYRYFYQI